MRLFTFLDYLFTGVLLLAVVLCSLAMGGCVSSDKSVTYESITFPETVTVDVSGLEKPAGVSEAVLAQHLHERFDQDDEFRRAYYAHAATNQQLLEWAGHGPGGWSFVQDGNTANPSAGGGSDALSASGTHTGSGTASGGVAGIGGGMDRSNGGGSFNMFYFGNNYTSATEADAAASFVQEIVTAFKASVPE